MNQDTTAKLRKYLLVIGVHATVIALWYLAVVVTGVARPGIVMVTVSCGTKPEPVTTVLPPGATVVGSSVIAVS